jgi:hypothetical protein
MYVLAIMFSMWEKYEMVFFFTFAMSNN